MKNEINDAGFAKDTYDLAHSRERVSVLSIYQSVLTGAKAFRERAKETADEEDKRVWDGIASELYMVASALENTEEINPKKN